MTQDPRRYFDELAKIQDRVEALFEEMLLRPPAPESTAPAPAAGAGRLAEANPPGVWTPAVDVLETDRELLLYAELPGIERDQVELTVVDRRLELSGRRPPLAADHAFARMERSYGPFRRVFELPADIDPDGVSATFEDGVLRVTLPKGASSAGPAKVPIEPRGGG